MTLYWSAQDNSTSIEVWQTASEEVLAFPVAGERALDAFYHPFAHLSHELLDLAPALDRRESLDQSVHRP